MNRQLWISCSSNSFSRITPLTFARRLSEITRSLIDVTNCLIGSPQHTSANGSHRQKTGSVYNVLASSRALCLKTITRHSLSSEQTMSNSRSRDQCSLYQHREKVNTEDHNCIIHFMYTERLGSPFFDVRIVGFKCREFDQHGGPQQQLVSVS